MWKLNFNDRWSGIINDFRTEYYNDILFYKNIKKELIDYLEKEKKG